MEHLHFAPAVAHVHKYMSSMNHEKKPEFVARVMEIVAQEVLRIHRSGEDPASSPGLTNFILIQRLNFGLGRASAWK